MAVADVTPSLVPLPNQRRIVARLVLLRGVNKWGIPTPGIGPGETHAALKQVHGGVVAHATTCRNIVVFAVLLACSCVDNHDFERLQRVSNPQEFSLHLLGRNNMSIG